MENWLSVPFINMHPAELMMLHATCGSCSETCWGILSYWGRHWLVLRSERPWKPVENSLHVPWQLGNIECVIFIHHCGFTKHRLRNIVFITESPARKQQDLYTIWKQICIFYVVCHRYIGNVAVFSTCWMCVLGYVICQLRGNGVCVCV